MAEQPENDPEVPEDSPAAPIVYRESADHVPDPTAMSGTLETSGTGGGHNERITGMTGIFGPVERDIVAVREVVQRSGQRVVEEVQHILHQEPPKDPDGSTQEPVVAPGGDDGTEDPAGDPPAAPQAEIVPVKTPVKKAAAKKTTTSDATK